MLFTLGIAALLQLPATIPTDPDLIYNGQAGRTQVRMSGPVDATIVVDGRLDEDVWRTARLLTGFSQYAPVDQRPAPDSTEVLVWYSPTAIHFGIRAFEPHGEVRATLADRDRIGSDDRIEIHLDTYEQRRRAFVFIVNPMGVQADGTKNEGGGFIPGSNVSPGQIDLSADLQWQSRGHVTEWGYEVEVRIPFSSLRFPSAEVQRWGVQFVRHVQHSGYEQTWTAARRASASFIAQQGWLEGLTGMQHGVDIALNPELTSTIVGSPCCAPDNNDWSYSSTPRIGGNVRLGLGSNFVLNGTVRPDFSQVEADATQVAADQRFALFYAERRPFFVEGSDQFNVPNTLVYTRRIVQPDAALKLTGRVGRMNVALLSAADVATNAAGEKRRPMANILRLTRDFSVQSTAGLLYSERVGNGRANRTVGADLRHVFGLYYAQFQLAASSTGEGGATETGVLWDAVIDRTGRSFGFHYSVIGIQPEFRTDNGFVARTGYVQPSISNRFTLFGNRGELFERYNVFLSLNGVWSYSDFFEGRSLLESRASANNSVTLRGGWQLSLTPTLATYAFDPNAYSHLRVAGGDVGEPFVPPPRITTASGALSVSTPQFRRFSASAGLTSANEVDFLETTRVRRQAWNASVDLRPTDRLRVNATYASNAFERRLDGLSTFSTSIPRVRVEYQLARPLFVRVVSQYEATRREPLVDWRTGTVLLTRAGDGSFVTSMQQRSNLLRTDWLFSYRPRPGTVFFAGYGSSMTEPGALAFNSLRRTSDGFFVKASYLWERRAM